MPEWVLFTYGVGVVILLVAALVIWAREEEDLKVPARLVFLAPLWPLAAVLALAWLLWTLWCAAEWREWFRG